jgi:hypothetical protein
MRSGRTKNTSDKPTICTHPGSDLRVQVPTFGEGAPTTPRDIGAALVAELLVRDEDLVADHGLPEHIVADSDANLCKREGKPWMQVQ